MFIDFLADPITHWRGREGRIWVELSRSTDLIRTLAQRSSVQYTFDARHRVVHAKILRITHYSKSGYK